LAFVVACVQPLAIAPTTATGTKDLVVCWHDAEDEEDSASSEAIMNAVGKHLHEAGYRVVAKGACDIRVTWELASLGRVNENDSSYGEVRVNVRERNLDLVDTMRFVFTRGQVPTGDSDLLATVIVNAVNASPKVAAYARAKH
jgi:hypothetical protein